MLACLAGMTTWGFLLKKSYGLRGQCGTSSKIRSDTGQKHSTKADSRLEMRKAAAEPAKHKSGYDVLKERAEEPEEKDELQDLGGSSAGADQVRCWKERGHLRSVVQGLNKRWWMMV